MNEHENDPKLVIVGRGPYEEETAENCRRIRS